PSLHSVVRIAERFPALRIVIDHLGRPSLAAGAFGEWACDLESAARYPQVFGKLSGLITDAPTQWKAEQLRPYALHALSVFGPTRLGQTKKKYPDVKVYEKWREMLDKEGKSLDAACVGTPDHMHAPMGMSAMRRGLHVYMQKPLAHDIYEVRRLTGMARKKK